MPKTAVIIPAYNEERNIEEMVLETKKSSPKSLIIVVDDGSKDNTAAIAKKCGAIVIKNHRNLGKSESIKNATKYLFGKHPEVRAIAIIDDDKQYSYEDMLEIEAMALIDADNQYFARDIPRLVKPILENKADFVIGRRDFSDIPFFGHRLGVKIFALLFNFLYGTSFRDTVCGLRAISTEAFKRMELKSSGYAVESEMLVDAVKKKMRIATVPVKVRYNRSHTVRKGSTMSLNIILHLILWKFFDRKVVENKMIKILKWYQKIV
jgi:glycosyltransferase involved in cell wall biosynthesis